jgi:Predicted membrane protein
MDLSVLLSWILCGLVVGVVARLLVPGPQPVGLLGTILVGVIGAFVGGAIYWAFNGPPGEPFSLAGNAWHGWLFSILGAVVVLLLFVGRPRRSWE